MTHDELLAKINKMGNHPFDTLKYNFEGQRDYQNIFQALHSVMELPMTTDYKPESFHMDFSRMTPRQIAVEMHQWGYETAMNNVIQAIEKELG